ncbi:MAG: ATPase domain-containing protein [Methanomassiliicoccales archaeon]
MVPSKGFRIPEEIVSFFNNPGGHSLILRGGPGAGKTTLALQTIEDMAETERGYYISTRVSDSSLFSQFSWLKERMEQTLTEEDKGDPRAALNDLKGIEEQTIGEGEITLTLGRELQELEAIFERVEENLPQRSLVVIDSLDALAEKYEIPCHRLMNVLQGNLVEKMGANLLIVLESQESQLDYMGDGVIDLSSKEIHRRRLREMDIHKLRGCEIEQPKYIFTLKGGKIMSFGGDWSGGLHIPDGWEYLPDQGEMVSTGISDLDRMLGGGLERGSITMIELGEGIPTSITQAIETSLVLNFAASGRGVLWSPLRRSSPEGMRRLVTHGLPQGGFDALVKVPAIASQLDSFEADFVLPVEGSDASADLDWRTVEYRMQGAQRPILSLMGFDTIESIYGRMVMDQLMDHLASVKNRGEVFVGLVPPSSRSRKQLADLANNHVKIERIGGTILLYGEEPFTECNVISFKRKERGGWVDLTPIV